MATRHLRFLKIAKEMASKTNDMRRGFGCIIVDKNKVVAMARNRKSHPKIPTNIIAYNQDGAMKYWGLHAECAALLKCDFSVHGMVAYIHGQNCSTGNMVNSEPCLLCRQVLKERGIKQAIYSIENGYEIMEI